MEAPELSQKFRILSWNLHKGFAPFDLAFVLPETKALIRAQNIDFALLQEVIGTHQKHPIAEQLEYLADQAWPHYAYGKNSVYDQGHHGNAILSHWPIRETRNHDISAHALEQRGILHARIEISGLHLFCTHFGLLPHWRARQLDALILRIQEVPPHEPIILAGDFNEPTERITQALSALGFQAAQTAPTFPSFFPFLTLDRVYARGLRIHSSTVLRPKRRFRPLSDHLPLMVEFDLESRPAETHA